jgi:hypothetical protein
MQWALVLALPAGCTTPPDSGPPQRDAAPTPDVSPAAPKLDLLFVVDDTPEFEADLQDFATGVILLFNILTSLPQRPDMHIGVITSDMGAGAFTTQVPTCMNPDAGRLMVQPRGTAIPSACQTNSLAGSEHYLIDDGAATNYSGDLGQALACLLHVGTSGCQFHHPLAAARAALGDPQMGLAPAAGNEGFRRDGALLAIFLFTGRDDCSARPDSRLFDPNDSSLGALTPFRCTEYGILCAGQPPPTSASGPISNCAPDDVRAATDPLHSLIPTQFYVDYFQRLQPNLVLYAWAGPPEPFSVGIDSASGDPELNLSCVPGNYTFAPALRVKQVVDGMGSRGRMYLTCVGVRWGVLADFANLMSAYLRP